MKPNMFVLCILGYPFGQFLFLVFWLLLAEDRLAIAQAPWEQRYGFQPFLVSLFWRIGKDGFVPLKGCLGRAIPATVKHFSGCSACAAALAPSVAVASSVLPQCC